MSIEQENKIYQFISLAKKANKIKNGQFLVDIEIKKKKSKLVIFSTDISERTKNDFIKLCDNNYIKYIELFDKTKLGMAIGKSPTTIISISDENFSNNLLKML